MNRENAIKKHFERSAFYYHHTFSKKDSFGADLIKRYLTCIKPLVKNRLTLEIGCGTGAFLADVCQDNPFTVGIDFSEEMVRLAKKMNTRTHLLVADALHLPFKKESFETIYSIRTFQHIPNYPQTIREMRRVLKSSGIAAFDFMNIKNPFGIFRSIFFRPFQDVYLRVESYSYVRNSLSALRIKIDHAFPIQFFLDSSNIIKYLPRSMALAIIGIFNRLDGDLSGNSFFAKFAFRILIVCRKL